MHQLQEVGKLEKLGGAAGWIHRPVTATCQSGEFAHHALRKLSQRRLHMNLLRAYCHLTSALLYLMRISLTANQKLDTNLPGGKATA